MITHKWTLEPDGMRNTRFSILFDFAKGKLIHNNRQHFFEKKRAQQLEPSDHWNSLPGTSWDKRYVANFIQKK